MFKSRKANIGLVLLGIVAIIAIIGLVLLYAGPSKAPSKAPAKSPTGASVVHPCTTSDDCPAGLACINGGCQPFEVTQGIDVMGPKNVDLHCITTDECQGQPSTLQWVVGGADSVTIDPGLGNPKTVLGPRPVILAPGLGWGNPNTITMNGVRADTSLIGPVGLPTDGLKEIHVTPRTVQLQNSYSNAVIGQVQSAFAAGCPDCILTVTPGSIVVQVPSELAVVSVSNPAARGTTVQIFLTGLGATPQQAPIISGGTVIVTDQTGSAQQLQCTSGVNLGVPALGTVSFTETLPSGSQDICTTTVGTFVLFVL